MKKAFQIPKRYCKRHGCEMRNTAIEFTYDPLTGAVEFVQFAWKCPRLLCFTEVAACLFPHELKEAA